MAWGQYANARARHRDRTSDRLEARAGFRLLHAAFAPRVGDQVVLIAWPVHLAESASSMHHEPFMIHCLAASI